MILSEWPQPFRTLHANVLNLILSSWKIGYSLNSTIQQSKPRSNKTGTYKVMLTGSERIGAKPLGLTACFLLQVASPFKAIHLLQSIHPSTTELLWWDWLNTWESPEFDECMTAAYFGFFCKAVAYIVWPVLQSSSQLYLEIQCFPFVAPIRTYSG